MIDPFNMWNLTKSRQNLFDHYLMLCKEPGWKDYAWQRVKELDKEPVYAGIKDYIMEQMKHGAIN